MGGFLIELRSCRHIQSSQKWFKSGLNSGSLDPKPLINQYLFSRYSSSWGRAGRRGSNRCWSAACTFCRCRSRCRPLLGATRGLRPLERAIFKLFFCLFIQINCKPRSEHENTSEKLVYKWCTFGVQIRGLKCSSSKHQSWQIHSASDLWSHQRRC